MAGVDHKTWAGTYKLTHWDGSEVPLPNNDTVTIAVSGTTVTAVTTCKHTGAPHSYGSSKVFNGSGTTATGKTGTDVEEFEIRGKIKLQCVLSGGPTGPASWTAVEQ
jgi:hypothetical protein